METGSKGRGPRPGVVRIAYWIREDGMIESDVAKLASCLGCRGLVVAATVVSGGKRLTFRLIPPPAHQLEMFFKASFRAGELNGRQQFGRANRCHAHDCPGREPGRRPSR